MFQVQKFVAVCFLEATKLTLEHLGAHRLEQSNRVDGKGASGSADLTRLNGETRRLRDYLQRCVSAFQDHVDIDLSSTDQGLLVAICRRSIEWIDIRLKGGEVLVADERQWLQKKLQVISDWTVELGEKPLIELPLPRLLGGVSEVSRGVTGRLHDKLFGDVNQRAKIRAPRSGVSHGPVIPGLTDEPIAEEQPQDAEEWPMAVKEDLGPLPQAFTSYLPVSPAPPPPAPGVVSPQLLRDPRLRSLVTMDLATYDRMVESKDWRLAVVMLASLLESVVIDHAITRRTELGLTGTPDTWNAQELLVRVMGDGFAPKDLSIAYHLFSARNLLRPAVQLVRPVVVTAATFERHREFVQRAVHRMGMPNGTGVAAPPANDPEPTRPQDS